MSLRFRSVLPIGLLIGIGCFAACQPSDPRIAILEQRARWNVELLSWAVDEGGVMSVSTRVSGPPNSNLEQLTFRLDLFDPEQNVLSEVWRTIDLRKAPQGAPTEYLLRVPTEGQTVDALTLSQVLQPTPEQEPHIAELQ